MKGIDAFCPRTGAPLSEKRYYSEGGTPRRIAVRDRSIDELPLEGELTNGEVRSTTLALFNYFRRCHQYYYGENQPLYRKALLGIRRLKRTANGNEEWDVHVWYALGERLSSQGYETRWMRAHAELRCPGCHGRLKYEQVTANHLIARCGVNCTDDGHDRLPEIRGTIAELYSRTFDDEIGDGGDLLRF